jgi:hypothetical protein
MHVFHNNVMNDDSRLLFLDSIAGLWAKQEFRESPNVFLVMFFFWVISGVAAAQLLWTKQEFRQIPKTRFL